MPDTYSETSQPPTRYPTPGSRIAAPFLILLATMLVVAGTRAAESTAFPHPRELEPDIQFWKRVYTEVDTGGGLLHDSRHLNVVYEVIRFRPGTSQRARERHIKNTKARYKKILRTLASGKRQRLAPEEKRVLALWSKGVSKAKLRAAARRLRFQLGQADKFRAGLIRSGAWEAHIRSTLSHMGLPLELAALPHVESSYNPEAYSHAGAAGLWQFTRSTGRRYLRVDHVVDERMDPSKATVAAARLLKHNRDVTGSWPLAITAYNHGASGMRRAERKLRTRDIATIVRRYRSRSFGFASRNFYVAFLAALEVATDADRYFGPLERHSPPDVEVVPLPDYMTVDTLVRALAIDRALLRRHNRALRESVWNGAKRVPRGYELNVPRESRQGPANLLLASVAPSERFASQTRDVFHKVRRGDTLSVIAARYETHVGELVALNGLRSRNRIRAGQVLRLPAHERVVSAPLASPNSRPAPSPLPLDGAYTVRHGDTLARISDRFGVDEQHIVAANGLPNRNHIRVGQTLQVAIQTPVDTGPNTGDAPPTSNLDTLDGSEQSPAAAEAERTEEVPLASTEETAPSAEDNEGFEAPLPTATQPELSADPSDYSVAEDHRIEVQATETLGHYAEWLDLRASQLRRINRMRYGEPVVIGRRLRLDFSNVSAAEFEQRRMAYHRALQGAFFERYQITGSCRHVVKPGESLWLLSQRTFRVPVWLLRQYNPDLDLGAVVAGTPVRVPILLQRGEASQGMQASEGSPPRTC